MNKFKTTIFILCLLGNYAANAQNAYWAMYSLTKFSLAQNAVSPLPGTPSTCNTANANGLFDANGNPVFYASNDKIYNKNGATVFTYPHSGSIYNFCLTALHIVPVPGGSCGEYYVIYAKAAKTGIFGNSYPVDTYEIGAIRVTVDASQNITVSNNISKVTYSDYTINPSVQMALSKENNNKRDLYVAFERSGNSSINTDQIAKIKVDNNGLTKVNSFLSTNSATIAALKSTTLELSPDQTTLAWLQAGAVSVGFQVGLMDVATGNMSTLSVPNLGYKSELEFGANSDDLYVTTSQGIYKTSLANPAAGNYVSGSGNMNYGGNIELGLNGKLHATSTNNTMYVITGFNAVTGNYYPELVLPEQVDGENIFYQAPTPLSNWFSVLFNGATQANVSGGSGNYSYTWKNSIGNVVATGNPVLLSGGKFGAQYTLTVKDNVTGCSTDFLFTNSPSSTFRNTSTDLVTNQVNIHPNPTSDYINVQTNANEQIIQLEVVNLKGQTALKAKGNQSTKQRLPINGLTKGMYILNIITNASSSRIKFLVK